MEARNGAAAICRLSSTRTRWTGLPDRSKQPRRLYALKKHPLLTNSASHVRALAGDILLASHRSKGRQLFGIFTLKGAQGAVAVPTPDGQYPDLAAGGTVEVKFGRVCCQGAPIIFEAPYIV